MRQRVLLFAVCTIALVAAACVPEPPTETTTTTTESTTTTSSTTTSTTTTLPNAAPTAAITASATSGVAHLSVDFSAADSTDDAGIASYAWNFGDGNTSTEADPQNLYVEAGTYEVSLTVTDAEGETDTDTVSIEATDDADGRYVATSGTDSGACSASAAPCATVQYAVNQADASGDTVYVDSGTYPEMVHVAKNLQFRGANQGNSAGADPEPRRAESTVKGIRSGTPTARPGNVQRSISIDGMAIDPQGDAALMTPQNQAIVWLIGGPDTVVENTSFNGGPATPNCSFTCTSMVDNGLEIRTGEITVRDNGFSNFRRTVNFYQTGPAGVLITEASFTGNKITGHTSRGLQIAPSGGNKSLVGVTVSDNVFDATGYTSPSSPGSIVVTTGTNTYTGNTFTGAASGIYLYLCTGPAAYVTGPQTIVGNDFTGGTGVVVYAEQPANCDIGNIDGSTIHENNFNGPGGLSVGSAATYFNGVRGPIDATCNWWNSPTGPNSGGSTASTNPNVVTSPWLTAPAPEGACTGA